MLATMMQAPEWALSEPEAAKLAESLQKVEKHFPAKLLSPKYVALGDLAITAGMIYGPRFMLMKQRQQQERAQRKAQAQAAAAATVIQQTTPQG